MEQALLLFSRRAMMVNTRVAAVLVLILSIINHRCLVVQAGFTLNYATLLTAPRPQNNHHKHLFSAGRQHRQQHRQQGVVIPSVSSRSLSLNESAKNDNDDEEKTDTTTLLEGIMPPTKEFNRLVLVDETIRALQNQIPTILTKPLTPTGLDKVYSSENFCFSVLVVDNNNNDNNNNDNSDTQSDEDIDNVNDTNGFGGAQDDDDDDNDSIIILRSRDELMALSDVLVLTTAVAQQAILVTGAGTMTDSKVNIECQLIVDEECEIIRIPWRATAPALGVAGTSANGSSSYNNFEGITDCYLSTATNDDDDDVGKVTKFVVRKASFNGQILNGPAIGQALKRIQSTVSNLQQNPILQNIVRSTTQQQQQQDGERERRERGPSIFNTLRDEILGQAATAVSARFSSSSNDDDARGSDTPLSEEENSFVPVYQVKSVRELSIDADNVWINDDDDDKNSKQHSGIGEISSFPPCPGTKNWQKFVDSRYCLLRFSNNIIPQLSDLSIVDSKLFAKDVTYTLAGGTASDNHNDDNDDDDDDESILLTGRESLANFFQTMALTRKGTGGVWKMTRCQVLDWKARTVAVSYEATTSSLPTWKIQGRDVYALDTTTSGEERPMIRQIQQGKMSAVGPNGNEVQLDGTFLVENVASAFQGDGGDGTFSGMSLPRDFLTELLMNQPSLSPLLRQQKPKSGIYDGSRRKLSESAAATSYYAITDLYKQGLKLFDMSSSSSTTTTRRPSPPGMDYMSENVELKGYLGESILRGSSLYGTSVGSVIAGIRESIRQKRLFIEDTTSVIPPPRVEVLVPTGEIRLSLTYLFRIPPPGVGILPSPLDSSNSPTTPSLPLKVELTSNYKLDPDTGLIVEHRLVETRINGQLTPGDQVSRWMRRFLNRDGGGTMIETTRSEDGALKAISDALSWFRSM